MDLYDSSGIQPAQTSTVDRRQYLVVLRRRFVPALTMFVVVFIAGIVHGFTRVPVYQAQVRVLIDRDRGNVSGLTDPLAQDPTMDADFQTLLLNLQSRSLMRRTMQALEIWDPSGASPEPRSVPVGAAAPADGAESSTFLMNLKSRWLIRRTMQTLGIGDASTPPPREADPPAPASGDAPAYSAKIDDFLGGVRVSPVPNSRLVDVGYVSLDPVVAATYANTLVDQFIQQNLEYRSTVSKEVSDWLVQRLVEQRKALEAANRALQNYRERHGGGASKEQADLLVQKLADLTASYTKTKTERIEKEALYTQIEALQRENAPLDGLPLILTNPVIQQLMAELTTLQNQQAQLAERFGDRHPTLVRAREAVKAAQARIQGEVAKVVESVRQDLTGLKEAEAKFAQALEAQKQETSGLNRSDVDLAVLQRDAESNRQIYESLQQRVNEFSVTREHLGNNIQVIDPAEVPERPLGSAAASDVRYGAVGGLVLALCVAFGLERLDNRVRTPQQFNDLGAPLLGLVPRVRGADRATGPVLGTSSTTFDEAFRSLRTNLRMAIGAERGRSILVTSACGGDGKTVVAKNLALALAISDEQVLIVDADLRRAGSHAMFGLPEQPGLTDLLLGQAAPADVVHPTDTPGLKALPRGTKSPNPSELLDSPRFKNVLAQLCKDFDWVVLDAPPVMAVTDSIVLCGKVTGVLIVAAAEATPLPALQSTLERLRQAHIQVIGAVLNRADLRRRRYYYSQYYRREFERYYGRPAVQV